MTAALLCAPALRACSSPLSSWSFFHAFGTTGLFSQREPAPQSLALGGLGRDVSILCPDGSLPPESYPTRFAERAERQAGSAEGPAGWAWREAASHREMRLQLRGGGCALGGLHRGGSVSWG